MSGMSNVPEHDAPDYTEDDTLLAEVIEDYIEDYGIWMFITYPGVYDILKTAFAADIETKRQERLEEEEDDDDETDE